MWLKVESTLVGVIPNCLCSESDMMERPKVKPRSLPDSELDEDRGVLSPLEGAYLLFDVFKMTVFLELHVMLTGYEDLSVNVRCVSDA